MEAQKEKFYEFLEEHMSQLNASKKEHFVICQEKYDKIINVLSLDKGSRCTEGAKFKFRCQQHYKLQRVGAKDIVFCSKTVCPVVTREELFSTIARCHDRVGHGGRDKTWAEVKANYAGVKHGAIDLFLKTCTSCAQRQVTKRLPSGKPMINLSFLLRVQIDLIDFRSRPDNDFHWVLHTRDCFSKFSWAYPLRTKTAAEVASHLFDQFCTFGPPRILQSDNGREFTANVIKEVCDLWPDINIIHGRPRHPESQGCVERGNGDLQIKLGKWMDIHGSEWTKGLKLVVHSINTSTSGTTGRTPYELVFGQKARSDQGIWEEMAAQGIVNEEDLPWDLLQRLNTAQQSREEAVMSQSVEVVSSGQDNAVVQSQDSSVMLSIDCSVVQSIDGSVVQLVDGSVVQSVDGSVVQSVDGSVVQSVDGSVVQSVDGSVVQSVDGLVVQSVDGSVVLPGDGTIRVEQLKGNSDVQSQNDYGLDSEIPRLGDCNDEPAGVRTDISPEAGLGVATSLWSTDLLNSSVPSRPGTSETNTTCHGQKRGRERLLLYDNMIVGVGTEHTNREFVHGVKVDQSVHVAISVDQVFVPTFVPTEANPMQEPLEIGQFVLWKRSATVETEDAGTMHREGRLEARKNYLKAARRQESRYQKKVKKVTKSFSKGNTVGVRINSADRTNTDVRLLTCKILETKVSGDSVMYKVYCPAGIVKNWFRGEELVDMSSIVLPSLDAVEPQSLSEVTLIHASRSSTRWQNKAIVRTVCACQGTCQTRRCPCRNAKIPCGTKCHPKKRTLCKNV